AASSRVGRYAGRMAKPSSRQARAASDRSAATPQSYGIAAVAVDQYSAMTYSLKVRATKNEFIARGSPKVRHFLLRRRGEPVTVEDLLRAYAPGRTMVDVGGMWGNDGAHGFTALDVGAKDVACVDLYRTEEFDRRLAATDGRMRFVYGDASSPATA